MILCMEWIVCLFRLYLLQNIIITHISKTPHCNTDLLSVSKSEILQSRVWSIKRSGIEWVRNFLMKQLSCPYVKTKAFRRSQSVCQVQDGICGPNELCLFPTVKAIVCSMGNSWPRPCLPDSSHGVELVSPTSLVRVLTLRLLAALGRSLTLSSWSSPTL